MDPNSNVWVTSTDPNIAPGLPALLGERSRVGSTIWFKIGPLDTDWALTPGGGGIPSAPSNATYWVSTANASLSAEVDMGALASGILQHTVALGVSTPGVVTIGTGLSYVGTTLSVPSVAATYITQTPSADLANEQALSGLASGVLSSVTATGVVSSTAFTATRIPFGSGTNGLLTESGNFTYDDATGTLLVGLTSGSAVVGVTMEVFRNQNAGTQFVFANSNAGAAAYAAFQLGQSANLTAGTTFGMVLYGTGSGFSSPITANTASVEVSGGSGDLHFWIFQNSGAFRWYTKQTYPNPPERMCLLTDGEFGVGNSGTFPTGAFGQFNRDVNGPTYLIVSNPSAGTSAQASVILSQSATSYTNYLECGILGSGFTTIGPYQASGAVFEHVTNTTAPMFFSAYGGQAIDFYTTTSRTLRFRIENDGDIIIPDLSAGGVVYATAATGLLKIGTSAEVAAAITWPTTDLVLVSSGATTAPVGFTGFSFDQTGDGTVSFHSDVDWAHYNSGTPGAANYERVRAFWSSNVWNLNTEAGGTGTERNMSIGNGGIVGTVTITSAVSAIVVAGTVASNPSIAVASQSIAVTLTGISRVSAAGATLDAVNIVGSNVSVTSNVNITTALGFNYIKVAAPTLTGSGGAKTIDTASTMVITGSPVAAGDVTITLPMTFWVQGGRTRLDGHATCAGSGSNLGFFGSNGAAQATSGANLTNNVTSGGTNDQIDNWTDLTTYATDAAAIRNAIYQLARKLKQINDGARTYNLFT